MKTLLLLLLFSLAAHAAPTIRIHDGSKVLPFVNLYLPGKLVMVDGKPLVARDIPKAHTLHKNLWATQNFFHETFGRASWDGQNADIIAVYDLNAKHIDIFGLRQNASWNGVRMAFGAGHESGMSGFEAALDVVAHEYTHAVISSSSNLTYAGQSGALNEHFADVFGIMVEQHAAPDAFPFLIGNSLFPVVPGQPRSLRNMLDPQEGRSPQPGHMSQLKTEFSKYDDGCVPAPDNDQCGVHVLSGIPNKMAALLIQEVGFEQTGDLLYQVMTEELHTEADFADYKEALLRACAQRPTGLCDSVERALQAVGL